GLLHLRPGRAAVGGRRRADDAEGRSRGETADRQASVADVVRDVHRHGLVLPRSGEAVAQALSHHAAAGGSPAAAPRAARVLAGAPRPRHRRRGGPHPPPPPTPPPTPTPPPPPPPSPRRGTPRSRPPANDSGAPTPSRAETRARPPESSPCQASRCTTTCTESVPHPSASATWPPALSTMRRAVRSRSGSAGPAASRRSGSQASGQNPDSPA